MSLLSFVVHFPFKLNLICCQNEILLTAYFLYQAQQPLVPSSTAKIPAVSRNRITGLSAHLVIAPACTLPHLPTLTFFCLDASQSPARLTHHHGAPKAAQGVLPPRNKAPKISIRKRPPRFLVAAPGLSASSVWQLRPSERNLNKTVAFFPFPTSPHHPGREPRAFATPSSR